MRASIFLFVIVAVALASCAQEEGPFASSSGSAEGGASEQDAQTAATRGPPGSCVQASAGMALPQRLLTMGGGASDGGATEAGPASADTTFLVADLWQMYETSCGGPCHDHGDFGGFAIPHVSDFPATMTAAVLAHVTSNGPTKGMNPLTDPVDPMPPFTNGGKPFMSRDPNDAIVRFATLAQEWLAAGSAKSSFQVSATPTTSAASQPSASFALTKANANALTLIGDCIPNKTLYATQAMQTQNAALDAMFVSAARNPKANSAAGQLGLPPQLSHTDLFTLDSAVLAQHGVVGYSPAYPLWSDNIEGGIETGKLRYVRVPLGTSIKFDKTTQQFTIPPNTRFYKTFMKRITDVDGSFRYRKVETRLIVSRPDVNAPDGTVQQTALYGTYKWRDDESDADIESSALNDGQPFADDLITYVKDEQLSPIIRAQNPGNPDAAEIAAGSRKHYAIPSSERCVECHMGSPGQSFVLGFTPVQINRRPVGQGGVIEPVGPDELTQLERLIDYGLITGVSSASDVLPLEQLEGSRAPRNDLELKAQGYMVGNCQHCHNPRGYPSAQFPVLKGVLNFLPGPDGGIFQFPLEKVSPRIFRGPAQNTPIPYITPSLMDLPPAGWETAPNATPSANDPAYGPKYVVNAGIGLESILFAPWRSLIFRNVKTPFTYSEDAGLFPHMPMNTPGYDVNAGMIMADWMVSIPAVRKNPQIPEYAFPELAPAVLDDSAQPYVEVKPGDPRYDDAARAAQARLGILHTGTDLAFPVPVAQPFPYYSYSPDTSDIRDPVVEISTCQTVPSAPTGTGNNELDAVSNAKVPDHAHWVITDLTEPQGPWGPRRSDWFSVLIPGATGSADGGTVSAQVSCGDTSASSTAARVKEQQLAVDVLQGVTLTDDFRSFATTPVPFGLWQKKSACTYPKVPAASSFTGSSRPQWMDNPTAHVAPTDPVYMQWPGQAVFNMVCINCHGSNFDGTGRLADNLLTMSGGTVRVADLHDGIFGSQAQPGTNRQAIFSDAALAAEGITAANFPSWASATVDDRASRYLAWMGLGGTTAIIPNSILNIVADTSVVGVHRNLPSTVISANMLSAAKALCQSVLTGNRDQHVDFRPPQQGSGAYSTEILPDWFTPDVSVGNDGTYLSFNHNLIATNGDAELWLHLCSIDNPPPVRVGASDIDMFVNIDTHETSDDVEHDWSTDLVKPEVYGASPVGNDRGGVDPNGITPTNLRPWCVIGSTDPAKPACPAVVASAATKTLNANFGNTSCGDATTNCYSPDDADRWATRGAINAGLAVFVYLDAVVKGTEPVLPDYTQCELLH